MLHTTSFSAPKALANTLLALTDMHPEISLDVGEDPDSSLFHYTLWLPAGLRPTVEAVADRPLIFTAVDETIDYVAQTKASFPPLEIGPYFIARNEEPLPAEKLGLWIAPNRAFGSGEHATTTGCLLAYEHLLAQGHTFTHGLDFGAGSGILALAAAKRQGTPMLALDNDAPSVEICAENAELNGVAGLVGCACADLPPPGPFDLIFANILLQPLLELAPPLVAALRPRPGAALILSGYTTEQGPELATRYTALGLRHTWRHEANGWLAEIWQRS